MDERRMLAVLTSVLVLQCVSAMFFHAPSSVMLQGQEAENNTDFGFSMAYMNSTKTLYVGAPRETKIGKVFNCDILYVNDGENMTCVEHYMEMDSSGYNIEQFPEQRFHLGATIVANNNYFFTCAPLWTTKVNAIVENGRKTIISDTFGTCFVQNSTHLERYEGLLEQYQKKKVRNLNVERFNGGTGWSTLLDEDNDLLLMTKTATFLSGDMFYVPASKPWHSVKSLNENKEYSNCLSNYWNIGFGLAAGKFFSAETMYAMSLLPKEMEGLIFFLTYRRRKLNLLALTGADVSKCRFIQVTNKAVGAMFGATMSSADLNMDGLDELLVGAPTLSEDECVECGALHIYTGGDKRTINERKRRRSIFGNKELGRFGSAIAAKDMDGDGKPELVVSAPYEDQGSGAIYILSGYEVYNTLINTQDYKSIQLSELKLKQRIHKESYKALGFSLQFVNDVDRNACDELAASSPGSSAVLLFKCVQKINVTLSSHLIGEQTVREQDKFFTVEVCARVELPQDLPEDIIGNITIKNSITGEAAKILQPNIVIDISCEICDRDRKNLCGNVTVEMTDKDPRYYTIKSTAVLQNYYLSDPNMTEFNSTWVETSPYSTLDASLEVSRHCEDDDCNPDLSMNIIWSGDEKYLLGSSANETVTIKVSNAGNASYSSCVWLRVTGAPLTRVGCEAYQEGYRCHMPKPLRRESDYEVELMLNMTNPTNEHEALLVEVYLYENCYQESVKKNETLEIPYKLPLEGVFNDGDVHRLNITDKQILDDAIVSDHHEFPIRNNGTITWKRVNFTVSMLNKLTHHYIKSFEVTAADFGVCDTNNLEDSSFIKYHCILDLPPNTTRTIIGTTEIYAGRLNGFVNGDELNMTSTSELFLSVHLPALQSESNTRITIQKEMTLANRKWLIALIAGIVALILLAILTIVLYKCGFFRRKQKQILLVAKESVRRKSIRRDTHASAVDGPAEGLQMDVDDDCPFQEARPVTTKDNVGLVVDDES